MPVTKGLSKFGYIILDFRRESSPLLLARLPSIPAHNTGITDIVTDSLTVIKFQNLTHFLAILNPRIIFLNGSKPFASGHQFSARG